MNAEEGLDAEGPYTALHFGSHALRADVLKEDANQAYLTLMQAEENYFYRIEAADEVLVELEGVETPEIVERLIRYAEKLNLDFKCGSMDDLERFYGAFKFGRYAGKLVIHEKFKDEEFFRIAKKLELPTEIELFVQGRRLADWSQQDPGPSLRNTRQRLCSLRQQQHRSVRQPQTMQQWLPVQNHRQRTMQRWQPINHHQQRTMQQWRPVQNHHRQRTMQQWRPVQNHRQQTIQQGEHIRNNRQRNELPPPTLSPPRHHISRPRHRSSSPRSPRRRNIPHPRHRSHSPSPCCHDRRTNLRRQLQMTNLRA